MATYNGEPFLARQLASIRYDEAQSIDLWISDDGSTDGTPEMLRDLASRWRHGAVNILAGPGLGFAENFRSLIVNPAVDGDLIAFCDQDDIWHADKLAVAHRALQQEVGPAMFCSRTRSIDASDNPLGFSRRLRWPADFRNALVENIASGNTMVFNRAAWKLLRESTARAPFVYHDWWAYIITTAANGRVHYSSEPLVDYRQHANNAIGLGNTVVARIRRIGRLLSGALVRSNDVHAAALRANSVLLTEDAKTVLERFELARQSRVPRSLTYLRRSGVFRQSLYGQLGLWIACLLRRL